ncbi:HD domain-containing protein [Flavobacterium sp. UBA4854]|uniref:HD domain-containing protein n=1 Tax=Flavobacterium sp. UBA4854 TaxID=1946548 RepID=UPI00257BEECF|nr:HD domain-containing protein [Flavobacterium sp. UBA4854]
MKTGKILDPIHGLIEITEIEEFIINQKIFGRLRKVKQNTLLNYIFPGANHTRFEHSIGVMHLSEIIFNKSNENVEVTYLKKQKYGVNKKFKSLKDILVNEEFETILQELRLAALLHDIGHGPTSHKFDDFTITGNRLIEIIKTESDIFELFLDDIIHYISAKGLETKRIEHELVSCVFIIKIINTLKKNKYLTNESLKIRDQINLKNILKMIDPSFLPNHEIIIKDKNYTNYFNSIIASFPFDADRMDYLYRDSFYSGVKYGFFDQSRILTSLLPIEHNGKVTLGIKKSGLDSVIRFIQSRNHLYNQVYFHKTNSATNSMLDFVFRHLTKISVLDNVKNFKDYEEFYCKNGDEYFFNSTLKNILSDNGCDVCGENCIENIVLDELIDRNLWKRCYEKRINVKNAKKSSDFNTYKFDQIKLNQIKNQLEAKGIFIQENYSSNLGLKGLDKSKSVLIDKDLNTISNEWDKVSDEMEFLSMTNVFIKRIYVRRTFETAEDFIKIENQIKELLKDNSLIED